MCGIIGYVGKKNKSLDVLIKGLKNLEYRGYDSIGIALKDNNDLKIIKAEGRIANLEEKIKNTENTKLGIGHTRWATHGSANTINAHPHSVGDITIVHNGIIENYEQLKKELIKNGYSFKSDTDTEVACALIDKVYKETKNKLETFKKITTLLKGSYAFGILFKDDDNLYAFRKDSPLIIGIGDNENYIASDVPAILEYTNKYILLDKNEYAVISSEKIEIYNDKKLIKKPELIYEGTRESAMKNGYDHFMIKEINEEPRVFKDMIKQFEANNIEELTLKMPDLDKYNSIDIVACGSAYHAGLVGKTLLEKYAKVKVNVEIASEYRYKDNFIDKNTLVILISQSGETADTLAALRKVKELGIDTLGIINTVSSSIAREAKDVLYVKAGAEISVATTKAYSAQVLMLSLLALITSYKKKILSKKEANIILSSLKELPNSIKIEITKGEEIEKIAKTIYEANNVFYIGRQIDYSLSMEGSLKLKEISYIHSEAYAAGELKHGTISLIEEKTPVISIVSDEKIAAKTISNMKEVKARGAYNILITTNEIFNKYKDSDFYDQAMLIKDVNDFVNPLKIATIIQLLAYKVAFLRGLDIDKPRNLAKSVTVE